MHDLIKIATTELVRFLSVSGVESKPASKDRIKTSQSEAWYSYWFAGVHTSGFIAN
jgi:hypothetical protein